MSTKENVSEWAEKKYLWLGLAADSLYGRYAKGTYITIDGIEYNEEYFNTHRLKISEILEPVMKDISTKDFVVNKNIIDFESTYEEFVSKVYELAKKEYSSDLSAHTNSDIEHDLKEYYKTYDVESACQTVIMNSQLWNGDV